MVTPCVGTMGWPGGRWWSRRWSCKSRKPKNSQKTTLCLWPWSKEQGGEGNIVHICLNKTNQPCFRAQEFLNSLIQDIFGKLSMEEKQDIAKRLANTQMYFNMSMYCPDI